MTYDELSEKLLTLDTLCTYVTVNYTLDDVFLDQIIDVEVFVQVWRTAMREKNISKNGLKNCMIEGNEHYKNLKTMQKR